MTVLCFNDTTAVNPGPQDGGSTTPINVDPYDLIMLDFDDFLPLSLTPLVLPLTMPEPVCEMQTPALFTIAHASPQPQSVDLATHIRLISLPSPATCSSSSGEFHLHIGSYKKSPTTPTATLSSSQEFLLHGRQPVPQPTPPFTLAQQQPQSVPHPQTEPPHSLSWADEVAAEQSGHSKPETVVPNGAYPDRIRAPPSFTNTQQYPPLMPTPVSQPTSIHQPRYGVPRIPPPQPQPPFPQPRPYDCPTSTDRYLCTDPSPGRRPAVGRMRFTLCTHRRFRPHHCLLFVQPERDSRLQAILQLETNPHCKTVRDSWVL